MAQRRRQGKQQLARLCDLVATSLLPLLEPAPPSPQLTREAERRLLFALSLVNRTIRGWDEEEFAGGLDQAIVADSREAHNCCLQPNQTSDDGLSCLANIISIVVGFLGSFSDYVKHSAGNILITISSSLIKFEIVWIQFVQLLWVTAHATSAYAHYASPFTIDSDNFICGTSFMECLDQDISISSANITSFITALKLRSIRMSRQMLVSLFRVLHTILKYLKHNDCVLKGNFTCLSILHLHKMPWDSYYQLITGEPLDLAKDDGFHGDNDLAYLQIFPGAFLQLSCSLVEQSNLDDINEQDMYANLRDLVPKLLSLKEHQDGPKDLSQYLNHKILMLMMRLKPHMQQHCSHIVSWLKLLGQYFQDLLYEPMQHVVKPDNCLEGSPFLSSILCSANIKDKSTRHLQRQATYLFLSCCLCLANNENDSRLQCSCKRDAPLFDHELQGCSDHCNCIGLSAISDWFRRHCLSEIVDSKSSTDFALSFMQLYMEEDDMLFSTLLELLNAPSVALKIDSIGTKSTSEMIDARLFSSIFDPVHLFHLLLTLLHYDHLVLVDYLISKGTGVHCAQYLLRCLRLVSQSWHAFVNDSIYEGTEDLYHKRQKISKDVDDIKESSASLFSEGTKVGSSCGSRRKNNQQLYGNAKLCLLSLKKTVEDLNRKDLFPYNPKPLLRSLTRFEKLSAEG